LTPAGLNQSMRCAHRNPLRFLNPVPWVQLTFYLKPQKVGTNSSGMNLNICKMARSVKYRTYFIKRAARRTMHLIRLFLIFRPSLAPSFNHFKLVNHTSLMISTQSRLLDNCSCIVLPSACLCGRLSSCSTGRSCASKDSSFTLRNLINNWRTYMRG
jgi:hypothetical protein